MKRAVIISTIATLLSLMTLFSCDRHKPTDSSTSGITTLICDASFQNIMSQEVDVFEFTYPKASIMTYYTDEHSAIDSLITKKSSLIVTARELTEKQKAYLKSQNRNPRTQRIDQADAALPGRAQHQHERLHLFGVTGDGFHHVLRPHDAHQGAVLAGNFEQVLQRLGLALL